MTMKGFERRLEALEQASGTPRCFVCRPDEGRYTLPGGAVVDGDTFAQAVKRAGSQAVVIRVDYVENWRGEPW